MKLKNDLNMILRKSSKDLLLLVSRFAIPLRKLSKDSLLLVSRFAIPLVYALILPSMILYVTSLFHSGIELPPYPAVILIPVILLSYLLCLILCHRAVRRELQKRQDEPSHFWKALGKLLLFSIVGMLAWLVLFFLSKTTTISTENELGISAILSIILISFCGCLFARKDIASWIDSANNPDPDRQQKDHD